MSPSHLDQIEAQLRRAAASRRYADTARLAEEFGQAVTAFARTLPRGDPRAAEAGRRLDETLSWALLMLKAARAFCAAELRRVTTAGLYARPCGEPAKSAGVSLDG